MTNAKQFRMKKGTLSEKLSALDGGNAGNAASGGTAGALPILYVQAIADASGDSTIVVDRKIEVLRFWIRNKGVAAHATDDHVQLLNGSNAISPEVAKTATQYAIKEATTIDPTYSTIAAGGTMKFTAVKATNVACDAYVLAVPVA